MINKTDLPKDFKPYKIINICSNQLIDCKFIISIGNNLPILIGSGPKPLIWLSAIIDIKKKQYQDLIIASESVHPLISINEMDSLIHVKAKDQLVIMLNSADQESVNIPKIDLRPIGLNVHGDEKVLYIVNNKLTSNIFQNIETMIGFNE